MIFHLKLKILLFVCLYLGVLSTAALAVVQPGPQPPKNLRCEYLENPVGIDVKKPRFSWVPEHTSRGQKQTAYQIIISSSPEAQEGDIWDSNKVMSSQTAHVEFDGQELENNTSYYWKVRYWDAYDSPSPYSAISRFDTGLFEYEDWEAKWITKHNQLRKEFNLGENPIRARAFVSGLGYYELRINGKKVSKNVLDPGWTTYGNRVLYSSYDVTAYLNRGQNAIGAVLGTGWYKSQAFILQLHIETEEGEETVIISDDTWTSKSGPIVADSVYNGETYDARLETPGWDQPGFDDSGWENADSAVSPRGRLVSQLMPPIQVVDTIVPQKITNPEPGVYVFDMGQNFSGWAQLRVKGEEGSRVRMRYAELLYPDGTINQENLRSARAEDVYILKGKGDEIYEPRFTYHGFRYVELTGFPCVPTLKTLRGRVVHTAVEQTGSFICSKSLLNQMQNNFLWGFKTNLHSIPTDCCQRDERMGWLGDAHLTAEGGMMSFHMPAFYTKFLDDIRDVQDKKGTITDTVPYIWGGRPADPAWGTAYPLLCWYMYTFYGDTRILQEHYEGLKKYVDSLAKMAKGDVLTFSRYGDWVSIDPTPGSLVSTFFYYYDLLILSKVADILGYKDDAQTYSGLAKKTKSAFNKKYYSQDSGGYGPNTQTANALPLFLDMPAKSERGRVVHNLVKDILYKNNTHLTTGIMGTKYLMDVLLQTENAVLGYELATQTTYPSWGYMIENGATTLWELWQNKTGPGMNSHNHPMLGSYSAWFYRALAGIDQKPDSVGFEKIVIKPQMVRDLTHASGSIETVRGEIQTSWHRADNSIRIRVKIPINCEAEIFLPKFNLKDVVLKERDEQIYARGKFLTGIEGITKVEETNTALVIHVGSGEYVFAVSGN
ncbi:MAG: family 78 glycoside hydrolase catalytic domain [Candidatus Aminicenantes bacterium]|jgi:alpha-L-rhamnosidase